VELGEVEEVLRGHEEVREAAVVVREAEIRETGAGVGAGIAGGEEKRLVGYVVMKEGVRARSVELRRYVQERLPEYMVPQVIVELEEMPRLGNGKVNRRGLPEPGKERGERGGGVEYVGPRTAMEELLSGIWEEVLGMEGVGVEDNFFELGGHSLLATQVVSQVRQRLGIEMELRWMFETPTVAAVAEQLLADPERRPMIEKIAEMNRAIEGFSEEEVEELLSSESLDAAGGRAE
jgi:acyl carrier protein